ncbi:hypothetical protein NH340_JMT00935 [Sarcoptes scabiei]|nr:hypothetical protein NH340_JMT00935 [Sarcoptes scabiei]
MMKFHPYRLLLLSTIGFLLIVVFILCFDYFLGQSRDSVYFYQKWSRLIRFHQRNILYSEEIINIHDFVAALFQSYETNSRIRIDKILLRNGFNSLLNAKLALDRSLPDYRPIDCAYWHYNPQSLPTVTIVIPTEPFEDVLVLSRSLTSILSRTPEIIVKQIIVIVENVSISSLVKRYLSKLRTWTLELQSLNTSEFRNFLPLRVFADFESKIVWHKNIDNCGWSCSVRNIVANATGEVLLFLHSNIEIGYNWLPPLLVPLIEYPNAISIPTLVEVDPYRFESKNPSSSINLWNYGLNIVEKSFNISCEGTSKSFDSEQCRTLPQQIDLVDSPQFAITKRFLMEINLFDTEFVPESNSRIYWDFTMKLIKCRAKVLRIPCSMIHVLMKTIPNEILKVTERNYLAHQFDYQPKCLLKQFSEEVFEDSDQMNSFYISRPFLREYSCPFRLVIPPRCDRRISHQFLRRQSGLSQESKEWFPILDINSFKFDNLTNNLYFGELFNVKYTVCLSLGDQIDRFNVTIIEAYCHTKPITESFRLDSKNRLIFEDFCLISDSKFQTIHGFKCLIEDGGKISKRFQWKYSSDHRLIINDNLCLTYNPIKIFHFEICSLENDEQIWDWRKF